MIEAVWRDGGRFDGWSEHFSFDRWVAAAEQALAGTGVDLDWYTTRERDYDEVLPWDHLDSGLDKDWLWADWEDALRPDGTASRSRTAAGRPATTAASARRWAPRSRSAPPGAGCCRSPWSEACGTSPTTSDAPGSPSGTGSLRPIGSRTPSPATRAMTVLHATEPATVYLSLLARVDGLTVADVDTALYVERSLVKQLAMRRTLFVFPRDLLPAAWGSASARVAAQLRTRLTAEVAPSRAHR